MPKSSKPKVPDKADDKEQSEAFIKAAQEAETSEDAKAFEKTFERISKAKKGDKPKS